MPVDTRGFQANLVGKRLRIEIADGEVAEIKLLELTVCPEPEPCCGITYDLLATNRECETRERGATYWTSFADVAHFEVLGD